VARKFSQQKIAKMAAELADKIVTKRELVTTPIESKAPAKITLKNWIVLGAAFLFGVLLVVRFPADVSMLSNTGAVAVQQFITAYMALLGAWATMRAPEKSSWQEWAVIGCFALFGLMSIVVTWKQNQRLDEAQDFHQQQVLVGLSQINANTQPQRGQVTFGPYALVPLSNMPGGRPSDPAVFDFYFGNFGQAPVDNVDAAGESFVLNGNRKTFKEGDTLKLVKQFKEDWPKLQHFRTKTLGRTLSPSPPYFSAFSPTVSYERISRLGEHPTGEVIVLLGSIIYSDKVGRLQTDTCAWFQPLRHWHVVWRSCDFYAGPPHLATLP